MSIAFTFALSQNQTFELRCNYGNRRLDTEALGTLIDLCEAKYYTKDFDAPAELKKIGRELYQWFDGKEGWLRRGLESDSQALIYLDLIQTSEAEGLNPQTQKVALGLAHLPWELLHDGSRFLLIEASVLPVRSLVRNNNSFLATQNRPLRLLFMATSPEHPGVALLGFEQEETNILKATKDQPLTLVVEESGSVEELENLVRSYPEDYFDVFHLTGHGVIYTEKAFGKLLPKGKKIKDNTPCFITEDDLGKVVFTTAEDLGKAFVKGNSRKFPRVIFLSGCHTGQLADGGTVPSMAQALVKQGAAVVLGWARPVYDTTGIIAATAIYQALATGATIEEAIIAAHQEMLAQECSDGHLLRVYRDTREIGGLVTSLFTKKREKLKFTASESEFLDENNIVKVASRGEFVGRRRALQRCLRALRETSDETGVFIAGMGGLGKSSLAARLCTRVQAQRENFERVVLVGVVDEVGLIGKLASKYQRFAGVPALLNEPGMSLQGRLQNFFEHIEQELDKPLLLVLDDFEQNIPKTNVKDGSLRMTTEAYRVLEAICAALAENQAESRLIVTCRYLEKETLPAHNLHLERLAGMGESDIDKIYREFDEGVREQVQKNRIIKIADGNPRLLKWLVDILRQPGILGNISGDELLVKLEGKQQEFRENILAETLLAGLEDEEREFLARLSVFRLPVTSAIIQNVETRYIASHRPNPPSNENPTLQQDLAFSENSMQETRNFASLHNNWLGRLISLSLVESATVYATQQPEYRVTTVLEPLLQTVLTAEEWQSTKKAATQSIYKTWWEDSGDTYNEEQSREIVRLAVLAEEKEIAVTVGDEIGNSWVSHNRYVEAEELCREILQLGSDYRILATIARAEDTLGLVENAMNHYQTALELSPEDNLIKKAIILHNMASLKVQQGDIEGAFVLYNQSLQIYESINNVGGKAATLHAIAGLKATQGDIEGAIALYNQSLQITESINDVQGKAATLHALAGLKATQGEIEDAIALYNQSLQIKESINNVKGKATTLHEIAGLKAQQGEIEDAIALYDQSLQIKESINDVQGKAATLHQLAGLKAQQGEIEDAIALYNQSLQITDSINDVQGKATTLHQLAGLKAQQGEIEDAIALYNQSLQIRESINDVEGKAATLNNMAYLAGEIGDTARGLEL
ncbi:tetratricopeptide repeat protein [Calothrix sp. PCC 6303]|uniref:tetratricopeptide repeat protein n=1 Tax=Calothrix sp. PCC 6303 TaxID=1170562 RepID=UPI0002A027EA|nr:tetratricopeptide repeat protein [Calothrix sp. PCC 6303]AFZ03309.1 Tetratricopeptide TPR_1 repeat-containing protein [Calothrix sp. PCC 6303]